MGKGEKAALRMWGAASAVRRSGLRKSYLSPSEPESFRSWNSTGMA